ncbi:hypothetical protein [Streptomyces sp. NPDC001536]|uniref:hypothetical protein n=1 Tax=Streptomyces sp. NPDC001536 TaxID=3364583 RepID=UPI00368CB815
MSVSTNGAGPRTSGASPLPELEGEWEGLYEGEDEGEDFLSGLAGLAGRAARSALGALTDGDREEEFEFLLEGEDEALHEDEFLYEDEALYEGESLLEDEFLYEDEALYEDESLYEDEALFEDEDEGESEFEATDPLRRISTDALMEHLGHAAATARSEAEAEAFAGALVPLAVGAVRSAAPAVVRRAPQLVRGLANVTRTLRRNPATRSLVRAVPTIALRTTRSLARQVARGRPVTARSAVRTLAGQTAAVLSDPRRRRAAVRRSRVLDRRYHRAVRTGAPGVAPVSAAAVRRVAAAPARGALRVPVAGPPRSFPRRRGAPARHPGVWQTPGPRPPAGLPPLSVAWVPVPAYRPVRPRGPYGV